MLSHYLTKTAYLFVDTFTLHGLFSADFHNANTRVNVKGSVVHGPEEVLATTHLIKGYVKDFVNSLESNRERVAFIFSLNLISITREKIITTTRKCRGKCMKPEPSEVKTDQSIKTGLNLESHPFSNKWRGLF